MNTIYLKIAIAAATMIVLCWLSHDYGATSVQSKWNHERAVLNLATAEALTAINEKNAFLASRLDKAKTRTETVRVEIKTETVEVEKEVIKYVAKYINSSCSVDDDWMRIYNASVARTSHTAPAPEQTHVPATGGGDDQ